MKRYFELIYWSAATLLITLIFMSLTQTGTEAFALAVMLLPGALLTKMLGRTITFTDRRKGVIETIYLLLIVLVTEYLAIILIYGHMLQFGLGALSSIVYNPIFIWLLLITFLGIEYYMKEKLNIKKLQNRFIDFTSDRRKVTLELDRILYIESCDDVVFVVTENGERYRTRMNISLWSNLLDDRFARVHRSFIVNRHQVERMTSSQLILTNGTSIDVSKKYRESIEQWMLTR